MISEVAAAPFLPDVARLREAVEAFRRRPRIGRTQEHIGLELSQVRQVVDLLEVEFSDIASEFAATDEYDQQGFDSPISWIKANCNMSGGAAGDRVCAGNQFHRLRSSAAAMAEGRVGFAHFALLARTAAAVGQRFDEARLLAKGQSSAFVASAMSACMHGTRPILKALSMKRSKALRREA